MADKIIEDNATCKISLDTGKVNTDGSAIECDLNIKPLLTFDLKEITLSAPPTIVLGSSTAQALKASANDIYESRLGAVKKTLEEQWEKDAITGDELAGALVNAAIQLNSSSLQDVLAIDAHIENQKLNAIKLYDMSISHASAKAKINESVLQEKKIEGDIILGLSKINESRERTKLYKEQAKGYSDQTRLNSIKIISNIWAAIFTQNQSEGVPKFAKTGEFEDTLKDWFAHLGLPDPTKVADDAVDKEHIGKL